MQEHISAFENRLGNLIEDIRPVYDETILLSRARKNIMRTLLVLEKMTEYFKIADEVDNLISKGIDEEKLVHEFCASIERLTVAKGFFLAHRDVKASAKAIVKIDTVLQKGMDLCEKEVKKLLFASACLVEFTNNQFMPSKSKLSKFNTKIIIKLLECIGYGTETSHFHLFRKARVSFIMKDMQKLYENAVSKTGVQGIDRHFAGNPLTIPWNQLFLTLPYNQGTHPFKMYYSLVYCVVKGEYDIWSASLLTCRNKHLTAWWNEIDKNDADALRRHKSSELESLSKQISLAYFSYMKICSALYDDLCNKVNPLLSNTTLTHESTSIFKNILGLNKSQNNIAREHSSSTALRLSNVLFIRLDLLSVFLSHYTELREISMENNEENDASLKLTSMRDAIMEAIVVSIHDFITAASTDQTDNLPDSIDNSQDVKDSNIDDFNKCDMSPNTGHIISFSREIIKYDNVYSDLIECASSIELSIPRNTPVNVIQFTSQVHSSLIKSLEARYSRFENESKASHVSTVVTHTHGLHSVGIPEANERIRKACKHLYMANNLCPLYLYLKEKGVKSSKEITWDSKREKQQLEEQQNFLMNIETRLKFEAARFVDTIVEALGLCEVLDDLENAGGPEGLMEYEKGKILKQKFSTFNATMEAWVSHQGEWRITVEHLREMVKKDLNRKIMPIYTEFFEKYSVIKFSKKNLAKYLKFLPEDVESIINGFFR